MTRRATARGRARTPLDGRDADVLVCGGSFAGLAVARELRGIGARVLVLDRYELGERATSACAAPARWLRALGLEAAIQQEIPCMRFSTPHGTVRYRLPWAWAAFDYRRLCELLFDQARATFETATVRGRTGKVVHTDRGDVRAPFVVDALGWRRVLAVRGHQPPEAPLSRGLEVHPRGTGADLEVWIDRSLVRRGYAWEVPAGGELRVGVGSYEPRDRVRAPTVELARRRDLDAVRYQGNWFPHRLRAATEDGTYFVGDAAGHCLPLSGEGIRPALCFGLACGRELRAAVRGERGSDEALERYHAFSEAHRPAFRLALALQRAIPALPPRLLTLALRALSAQAIVDRIFGWYLDVLPPAFAFGAPSRPSTASAPAPAPPAAR